MNANDIAQGQLDEYNNQDLESFLIFYSEDVEVYNFPDELVYKGKEIMREKYRTDWEMNPDQKVNVSERMCLGNTVIDKEQVTGRASGIKAEVIAVYNILDGIITKVFFIRD